MKFEDLKEKYAGEEVTEEQFREIEEHEEVKEVINCGVSGQYPDSILYTVYSDTDEFEIYS